MNLRMIGMLAAIGVAAIALVGAGAHAAFTTQTSTVQSVSTGTLSVVIDPSSSSPGVLSNNNQTITFAALTNQGSSFTTGDEVTTMLNNGTLPANEITVTTAASGSSALANDLYFCEVSSGTVIYNGPVSLALGTLPIAGTISVGGTDNDTINLYAGSETTACGDVFTAGPLQNGSPGATATTGTSPAPSLTNADEGATLSLSLTVGYSA